MTEGSTVPLLVAQDFTDDGVKSGSPAFTSLLSACGGDFELFWWALLYAALVKEKGASDGLTRKVSEMATLSLTKLKELTNSGAIEKHLLAVNAQQRRVFLIDGVETAVPAARLREFVESLFRFLATVQYSGTISSFLTIRLFLRSDLHKSASQNIEQQIEGAVLHLSWDRTSIFNFAVARVASLNWFRINFSDVCSKIEQGLPVISRGGLNDQDAEALLLEIFPPSLERNRLKTTTFLASYFSDAGGESEAKASFYPRLFDGFLREMDNMASRTPTGHEIENGRLGSSFVLKAYDAASGAFIDEVTTELHNLLDLVSEPTQGMKNSEAVSRLLEAFSGLKTPFLVEQTIDELANRTSLPKDRIRDALGKMKQLGIFENRPGKTESWRTGRLYKSGLKMKYVRAKKMGPDSIIM